MTTNIVPSFFRRLGNRLRPSPALMTGLGMLLGRGAPFFAATALSWRSGGGLGVFTLYNGLAMMLTTLVSSTLRHHLNTNFYRVSGSERIEMARSTIVGYCTLAAPFLVMFFAALCIAPHAWHNLLITFLAVLCASLYEICATMLLLSGKQTLLFITQALCTISTLIIANVIHTFAPHIVGALAGVALGYIASLLCLLPLFAPHIPALTPTIMLQSARTTIYNIVYGSAGILAFLTPQMLALITRWNIAHQAVPALFELFAASDMIASTLNMAVILPRAILATAQRHKIAAESPHKAPHSHKQFITSQVQKIPLLSALLVALGIYLISSQAHNSMIVGLACLALPGFILLSSSFTCAAILVSLHKTRFANSIYIAVTLFHSLVSMACVWLLGPYGGTAAMLITSAMCYGAFAFCAAQQAHHRIEHLKKHE
jgi:O-antigen/teichoic acid export membrane protein